MKKLLIISLCITIQVLSMEQETGAQEVIKVDTNRQESQFPFEDLLVELQQEALALTSVSDMPQTIEQLKTLLVLSKHFNELCSTLLFLKSFFGNAGTDHTLSDLQATLMYDICSINALSAHEKKVLSAIANYTFYAQLTSEEITNSKPILQKITHMCSGKNNPSVLSWALHKITGKDMDFVAEVLSFTAPARLLMKLFPFFTGNHAYTLLCKVEDSCLHPQVNSLMKEGIKGMYPLIRLGNLLNRQNIEDYNNEVAREYVKALPLHSTLRAALIPFALKAVRASDHYKCMLTVKTLMIGIID